MKKFHDKYRIPTARATWWNYGNNGLYFITICTAGREHYFGEITNQKKMKLTPVGEMALQCWLDIPNHFPFAKLDAFVVMPNHIHGILEIDKTGMVGNGGMIIDHGMIVETQNIASLPTTPDPPDMIIDDNMIGQTQNIASLRNDQQPSKQPPANQFGPQSQNLASILRGYKIGVKKFAIIHQIDFDWQTRYHDHIIRNDEEYYRIRDYIIENPNNWKEDG